MEEGIITSGEALSSEEHKKKLAEDARFATLARRRKVVEDATMMDIDGEFVPEEVVLESVIATLRQSTMKVCNSRGLKRRQEAYCGIVIVHLMKAIIMERGLMSSFASTYENSKLYKQKVKIYHDKKLPKRNFQPGQQALLFNSRLRLFLGKLKSKWSGPFIIQEAMPHGAVILEDPTTKRTWTVNGSRIKHYLGGDFKMIIIVVQLQEA
ncbi:hypothetical protein D0Y65_021713 [Glycine soja]|uniref:Uncharacterized protein n=1 Tax=Glycine soja TaxID=3848 RepID=A0A445JKG1_GLYSO|nr:hypothetical protein D0Y65_021713 [Glycine soja]